jgi:hypothetical protein
MINAADNVDNLLHNDHDGKRYDKVAFRIEWFDAQ